MAHHRASPRLHPERRQKREQKRCLLRRRMRRAATAKTSGTGMQDQTLRGQSTVPHRSNALIALRQARQHLADHLAVRISACEREFVESARNGVDPIANRPEFKLLCEGIMQINHAVAALRISGDPESAPPAADAYNNRESVAAESAFGRFFQMVAGHHLEEAARELARMIRMPGDSAFTATRFFARAWDADPGIADRLVELTMTVETLSIPDCMDTLVAAFGLQAVECTNAIHALREHARALGVSKPASGPVISGR